MDVEAPAWRGRRVLVTGHTGFKGAWLVLWLEQLGADVTGLALAPRDPTGAWSALAPWPAVRSHEIDVRDLAAVRNVVHAAKPEVIFHLAAQAIVREGFDDPVGTYATNLGGTVNLLEAVRSQVSVQAVVVVTSDKVYENPGTNHAFTEQDRLGGTDPYSSSKACAELAVAAWRRSFLAGDVPGLTTARAGNVLGGGDRGRDRLAPDVQHALRTGSPVRLRHPDATRPWQFVLDPLRGYLLVAQHLLAGGAPPLHAVNFGPSDASGTTVRDIVERLQSLWGSGSWEKVDSTGGQEAPYLRLNTSLADRALGWRPRLDLQRALEWTVAWWRAEAGGEDLRALAVAQLREYTRLGP